MEKKPVILAIVFLCIIIVGIWIGKAYFDNRPQVSKEDSNILLSEYKKNIEDSYEELNIKYESLDKESQGDEWQTFSKEWMQKQMKVRPLMLDKKLPEACIDKRNLLMAAQNELLPLWTEYNREFEGKSSDGKKIQQLKEKIERIFQNTEV